MLTGHLLLLAVAMTHRVAADSCCCQVVGGDYDTAERCLAKSEEHDKEYMWRASAGTCCRVRTKVSKMGAELQPGDCSMSSFSRGPKDFATPINDLAANVYSPATCNRVCDDTRDCSGHGIATVMADDENCQCQCDRDFIGDTCHHKCDREEDCSGNGVAFAKDGACACSCEHGDPENPEVPGFIGTDCSTTCDRDDHCNGSGDAFSDGNTCKCKCDIGHTGDNCLYLCNREADCNGHGEASSDGTTCTCKCDAGFTGKDCDYQCTDKGDCNGHGVASSDGEKCTCKCQDGEDAAEDGGALTVAERVALNFGGKGTKKAMERAGFAGEFCDHLCDPKADCNGHGAAKAKDGKCECTCKETFGGDQCGECAPGFGNYPKCEPLCTEEDIKCNNGKPAGTKSHGSVEGCFCDCDLGFDPLSNCLHPIDEACQKWGTFTSNCNIPRCKEKCCYFPREFVEFSNGEMVEGVHLGNHIPREPVVVFGLCNGPKGSDGEERPMDVKGHRRDLSDAMIGPACNAATWQNLHTPVANMDYFNGVVRYPCGGYYVNYLQYV